MNVTLVKAVVDQLNLTRNSSFDDRVWSSFSEADWEKAFTWLDLSGLALHLRDRLERMNSREMIPVSVRERLDRCQAENRLRVQAMTEELKVLSGMFKSEAIEHLVLKGFSLYPDYCGDPAIRTQYDHDFLIRSDSVSRTAALFQAAGYRRKISSDEHPIEYRRPDRHPGRPLELVGYYSPQLGRSIELHYRLWESAEEKIEIDLARDFFEHAAARRWNEIEYMGLGDEDALVFQVLHAFRHILRNWCRLSAFLEIAHFLNRRSADTSFWIRFARRINEVRWVPEATMVVFCLSETLFGAPIPEAIKWQLTSARYPVLALWTERYGRNSALANFQSDKYSLFLHREFVQDSVTWAGIRKRRLFPVQRPHRLPAAFQRRSSRLARLWIDGCHAIRRVRFHAASVFKYAWEYPRWMRLRRRSQALTVPYAQVQSTPRDSSWNC